VSRSRWATALVALAALAVLAGCGDSLAPHTEPPPAPPAPLVIPPFVFVADVDGTSQLFRLRNDSIVRLTSDLGNDADPKSAAGRIVFTSDRDGNVELYIADLDAATQLRVTNSGATDEEPALSPRGDTIAFVSNRSGISRIWMIGAPSLTSTGYGTPLPLETGSPAYVPEHAPSWSPDGAQIAFVSARTGQSQVFVVPSGGGAAVQVTHESGGAFAPVWSSDGTAIIFVSGTGTQTIRRVVLATGVTAELAADTLGVSDPSCGVSLCLATTDPFGDGGDIVAVSTGDHPVQIVLPRANRERQPAILVP
jgi:dipeptidyl aminopeptidase/acylaminoacyl peptidase